MALAYVYGIYDLDNAVRYVGKTRDTPSGRLRAHISNCERPNLRHLPISCWLRGHRDDARVVDLEMNDWTDAVLDEHEREWITFFGLDNLLNVLPGGEGGYGPAAAAWHARQSPEMRTRHAQHRLAKARGECRVTGAPQADCLMCTGRLSFATLQRRGLTKDLVK